MRELARPFRLYPLLPPSTSSAHLDFEARLDVTVQAVDIVATYGLTLFLFFREAREAYGEGGRRFALWWTMPAAASAEAVPDQGPDGEPSIGVANLFSFNRRPRIVGDIYFGDFLAHAAELRRHFGAEFEALAVKIDL